eukprot:CAMPEP_0194060880 /NCGR_PEP_ID=MMETSP0009_2-20130614/73001_1 /TAXON_ID=210454 /ORGANISM="Grammatophora oceanica, Strain CCMP 410" /LENGTH=46 /DNA_ID= /DNA_START= /DNA_END= /DNA_ORIENTATION=
MDLRWMEPSAPTDSQAPFPHGKYPNKQDYDVKEEDQINLPGGGAID